MDAEGLRDLLKRDRLVGRGQGSLFADRGSLFFRVDGVRLRLGLAEGVARYEEVRDLLKGLQKLRDRGALTREACMRPSTRSSARVIPDQGPQSKISPRAAACRAARSPAFSSTSGPGERPL